MKKEVLAKQQNSENKKKRKSNSQIGKKNMTKCILIMAQIDKDFPHANINISANF
jgi:hypothetical protein